MKAKKTLINVLCASMVVSSITPAFATVINETLTFEDTATNSSEETEVLYEQSASYSVTIPKAITLGADKQSSYSVKVEGDIPSDKQVYVSPIDGIADTEVFDFYMKDTNIANPKDDVIATVTQNKFYWNFEDVTNSYEETENKVEAEDLTSGTWKGTFDFEINMTSYDGAGGDANDKQQLEAGLYDVDGIMLCSWEESGINNTCSNAKSIINSKYPSTTKIVMSDSVTSIAKQAFLECTSLTSIVIPNSVTSIGGGAFCRCTSLASIILPDSITSIDTYIKTSGTTTTYYDMFQGCTSLTSIVIPDSVTSIDEWAFQHCSSLTNIEIPDSVTSIGKNTFWLCTSLTNVVIPDSVTSIGDSAFSNCTSLTSIVIPDSVTTLENHAFISCSSLESVKLSNSIKSIGVQTFAGTSLKSIEIPDSVASIGKYAFMGCKFAEIIIPNSVTNIGVGAFVNCTSLTSIEIPDSVTGIGGGAFAGCTALESVILPNSLTSIDTEISSNPVICRGMFENCTSLKNIVIPSSVKNIGTEAFYDCTLLDIEIPNAVTTIGSNAFYNVPHITYKGSYTSGKPWGAKSIN